MRLKANIDIGNFGKAAGKCSGDVFLQTSDGNILNIKSLLTQYALISIMGSNHVLKNAQVVCVQEDDYQKLADFLEEEE